MSAPAPEVEIAVEDPRWEAADFDLQALAERAAGMALEAAGTPPGEWSVSVLATDDAEIAKLNAEWRGKEKPTNVLSWPAFGLAPPEPGARPPHPPGRAPHDPPDEPVCLGDVALAWETIMREAGETGLEAEAHLTHLILHGVLHLLGYDHETDADAALMEGLESRALAAAGYADPYAADAAARTSAPRG